MESIIRDKAFYRRSGGGVTISGGEPLEQASFAEALLRECQTSGIHTAIETCGYCEVNTLLRVLKVADYFLYDVKHCNSSLHKRYTRQPNELILSNLRIVAKMGIPFLVRMPVIPGVNDDNENLAHLGQIITSLGKNCEGVELMPYHRLGVGKYDALRRTCEMSEMRSIGQRECSVVKLSLEEKGIHCCISQ